MFHLGANSSTTEKNASHLVENNYRFTRELCEWCLHHDIRFIYASSAATYGDGSLGYSDSDDVTPTLKPLNMYGCSKQMFDLWAMRHAFVRPDRRTEIFQRLRSTRGPQGRHAIRHQQGVPPDSRNRRGQVVQVVPAGIQGRRAGARFRLCKRCRCRHAFLQRPSDMSTVCSTAEPARPGRGTTS